MPEIDAAFGQIIGRHLDGDAIAGQDADTRLLHSSGRVGQDFRAILELHAEACIRQNIEDDAFEFDQVFL